MVHKGRYPDIQTFTRLFKWSTRAGTETSKPLQSCSNGPQMLVLRHQNLYKAVQIVHHKGWYPDIRIFIWLLRLSTRAKPNVLNVFKQFRNSTRAGSQASKSLKGSLNGPHETQAYKSSQSAATKASKHLQGLVLSYVTLFISRIYRFIGTKKISRFVADLLHCGCRRSREK